MRFAPLAIFIAGPYFSHLFNKEESRGEREEEEFLRTNTSSPIFSHEKEERRKGEN